MSIRVAFDVGHSATVKGKTTAEGFTHDWELYVRGVDSNNIQRFVDKVVFNLHESFPKPKRAFKDPPYLLKECGYAGFELDIDIYFRCQRDEQKKITFRYDLTLPGKGSTSASERRYHTFVNPSIEFRRKLLEGGGIVLHPNASSIDDRSRDAIEDRTQLLSKPKLGSSSSSGGVGDIKKHKSKSSQDDNMIKPSSTFANLFGTPITKLSNSKQSPEQKISNNSSSSSINTKLPSSSIAGGGGGPSAASVSSGNSSKQIPQKSSSSSSSKDKSDKSSKSKKEKNKVSSSPMKDGKESTSSKKSAATSSAAAAAAATDDKHQRRDDMRKEKSHNKDRERSKDKPSKRPPSPKALAASRSPKRSASPSIRNSSSNRHLTDGSTSAAQSILSARHADEKASSSSTNKKSKKEKRDKSFEKDRERGVDGKKDGKSMPTTIKQPKDEKPLSKSLEKINGTSKKDRDGGGGSGNSTPKDSVRDKSSSSSNAKYRQVFDAKIDSPVEPMQKSSAALSALERESKKVDKHDGSDRKHKHKKKDKKEKGRSGSKDRKKDKEKVTKAGTKEMIDENSTSSTTNHKRSYGQTPPLNSTQSVSSIKAPASTASLISTATTHSKLSDDSSSDFDMDEEYPTTARPSSPPPIKHERSDVADSGALEQPNTIGLPEVITKVSPSHRAPMGESPTKQTKKSGKESKSKSSIAAAASSKEEFQGKRRGCKHSSNSSKRKTQSPASTEPPVKIAKKELIKTESNRDGLNPEPLPDGKYGKSEPYFPSRSEQQQHHHQQQQQPQQQNAHNQHQQQIQSDSITSNSSISLPNLSTDSSFRSPSEPAPVDYLSQLRTLQQKIMALQDNSEMQQVVEMIAATGCYEITSRTFDFDLCALDRTTVQRLQDFFSQSQSAVIK